MKPDVLLKGLIRADKLIDELCEESIDKECKSLKKSQLKNSYVIKGHGQGRGT